MDYLEQVCKHNKYTDIRYIKFTVSGRIAGSETGPYEKILEHLVCPPHENIEVKYSELVNTHTLFLYMQAELRSKELIKRSFQNLYDYQQPYAGCLSLFTPTGAEQHKFNSVAPGIFREHTHPTTGMLSYSVVYNIHDMLSKVVSESAHPDLMTMLQLED